MLSLKYSFIPGDQSSIQGSLFNGFYIDKKGNLWIASNAGINKIPVEQNLYDIIPVTETRNTQLSTSIKRTGL